jgi:hypothetical protein
MKAFQLVQTFGSMVVILVMALVWGVPLAPTIMYYDWATGLYDFQSDWLNALGTGLSISSSAIVYSFSLLAFSATLQFILHVRIKEKTVVPLGFFQHHSMGVLRANSSLNTAGFTAFCTVLCFQHLLQSVRC